MCWEIVGLVGVNFPEVWFGCDGGGGGSSCGGGGGAAAGIFSRAISCSIIVLWITSIAGDNRQAAERTGWYRTPTPVWEAVWIISCLPCRLSMGAGGPAMGGVGGVNAMTQFDFTGRAGGAQRYVSHSRYFIFYTEFFSCFLTSFFLFCWIQIQKSILFDGLWWCRRPSLLTAKCCVCMLSVSVSVTDTLSSRRPQLRSVQRSMQDSLSMVESWRKVIPGLSMIKLTPHRVSQIRFCALDTVAAAYSTLSRVQSHLSCWHHCIAITVSERENALGQRGGKEDQGNVISPSPRLSLSFSCLWFEDAPESCKCLYFLCGNIDAKLTSQ